MFAPSLIRVKSLETPVTRHCNLRCAACDHASSYLSKSFLDAGQFERDLNVLKKAMTADEFRMVGGEPLQHPELETLIEIVRRSGIAGRVVLVTNGVLLDKASDRLWQSIDRLWLSIYPGVSLGLPLDEIEARCRENNVVLDARPTHQFRVVLVNNRIEDKGLVGEIYRECKTAHVWKCFTVRNGYFYKCSKGSIMRDRLHHLGIYEDDDAVDGVSLDTTEKLGDRLQAYLDSREPLRACRFCLGTSGPLVPHRQQNKRALDAEIAADHRQLIQEMISKRAARSLPHGA
jgi:organic radical activating enzyme